MLTLNAIDGNVVSRMFWLLTVGRKSREQSKWAAPGDFCKGQDILEISVPKYLTDSSLNVPSASSSASA